MAKMYTKNPMAYKSVALALLPLCSIGNDPIALLDRDWDKEPHAVEHEPEQVHEASALANVYGHKLKGIE